MTNNTLDIFTSMVDIFTHIKEVQKEVQILSERSTVSFFTFIDDHKLTADEKTLEGFQYQDIITQQLSAVVETIDAIEKNISVYMHASRQDENMLGESIERLSRRLSDSLKTAKSKQEAFSGNALDPKHGDEINFF